MPLFTPPKVIGSDIPPEVQDAIAKDAQSKMSPGRQAAIRGFENAAEFIKGLIAGDDGEGPNAKGVGAFVGAALPMVSVFKTLRARQAATDAFRAASAKMPSANLRGALEEFSQKYPRVSAHIEPQLGPTDPRFSDSQATLSIPFGKVEKPMPLYISNAGVEESQKGYNTAKDLVFHEGTHAAQALGNSDMAELYKNAENLVGYTGNPFERAARLSEPSREIRGRGYTAIDDLNELAMNPPKEGVSAGNLREILADRFRRGWTPQSELIEHLPQPTNPTMTGAMKKTAGNIAGREVRGYVEGQADEYRKESKQPDISTPTALYQLLMSKLVPGAQFE